MAVLRTRAWLVSRLVSPRVEVFSQSAHFTACEPTTRNGSAACCSTCPICTGDVISWSTWIPTRNLLTWRYSLSYGILTNQKCDDFAVPKQKKKPTNFSNGFINPLQRSWDHFSLAGVLVFVDLSALVPTFLDLAFPVRMLVAHGARGSGSPGKQCSGSSTVCG